MGVLHFHWFRIWLFDPQVFHRSYSGFDKVGPTLTKKKVSAFLSGKRNPTWKIQTFSCSYRTRIGFPTLDKVQWPLKNTTLSLLTLGISFLIRPSSVFTLTRHQEQAAMAVLTELISHFYTMTLIFFTLILLKLAVLLRSLPETLSLSAASKARLSPTTPAKFIDLIEAKNPTIRFSIRSDSRKVI